MTTTPPTTPGRRGRKPGTPRTGGRKKGTPNKFNARLRAELIGRDISPLEYMLEVMRDPTADKERRDRMAIAAAPYCHPRLQTMTVTGADGGALKTETKVDLSGLSTEALRAALQIAEAAARSAAESNSDPEGAE